MLTEKQLIADIAANKIGNVYQYMMQYRHDIKANIELFRPYFLSKPHWAYYFARYMEQAPHDDTRRAACGDPYHAYEYAKLVDKCPRDDTRIAASKDSFQAFEYFADIDGYTFHEVTWEGACSGDDPWENEYREYLEEIKGRI